MNRRKNIITKLLKRDKRWNLKKNGGLKTQYISKEYQDKLAVLTAQDIVDYWYSDKMKKSWFNSTLELDMLIKKEYEFVWESALRGWLTDWEKTAIGCLALAIIFDQFPLNMFRGKAKSFQTEENAVKVTKLAIEQGFLAQLKTEQLAFLIMPLMHSENLTDQDLSVELFKKYNLTENLKFAEHHREIVKTYGRFPHRNQILDRKNSKNEQNYLAIQSPFNSY